MLYIAYGSTTSEKRMHEICPNAKFITKGFINNVTLGFHYHADLVDAYDYATPVVLWDIPDSEVEALDYDKGVLCDPPHYYKDNELIVHLLEPNFHGSIEGLLKKCGVSRDEHQAKIIKMVGEENIYIATGYGDDNQDGIKGGIAYVMTEWKKNEWEKHNQQTPIEYVEHILAGYKEQGFSGLYLHDLWYALYRGEDEPEKIEPGFHRKPDIGFVYQGKN